MLGRQIYSQGLKYCLKGPPLKLSLSILPVIRQMDRVEAISCYRTNSTILSCAGACQCACATSSGRWGGSCCLSTVWKGRLFPLPQVSQQKPQWVFSDLSNLRSGGGTDLSRTEQHKGLDTAQIRLSALPAHQLSLSIGLNAFRSLEEGSSFWGDL